ncbi:MAG: cysteine hydrolase family protein [Lachnospira sp.]
MKKILVVVDMQNDFLTGPLGNTECAKTVEPVVEAIKNGGYDAFYVTKDTHDMNYLETQEGKNLPVIHCIKGSYGWEVAADVQEALSSMMLKNKPVTYVLKNTFGSTELGAMLKKEYDNDNELLIDFAGVCTGICVISNVLTAKAFAPEAKLAVIGNACACVTNESHNTALEAMKLCQVEVR